MNELVLKMLEGPPRVFYAPIGWLSYEKWYYFPLEEWYHFLRVEVKRVEELTESEWRAIQLSLYRYSGVREPSVGCEGGL